MTTSMIGKMFLDAYNESFGTNYDACTFFMEQFYPLFFDHGKYMMTAGNSPLENPKISWDDMLKGKKSYETVQQRNARYEKLLKKIEECEADASIARGYASLDVNATTSGQVTDMQIPNMREDIFFSWMGDALGVGVQGSYAILFCNKEILLDIYKGWEIYRSALNDTDMLKGNQINTWNGQWLAHYYDARVYDERYPMRNLDPFTSNKDGILSIGTLIWTKVLIGIARRHKNIQMMGYVYSIGQTNTTIGFIPFDLSQIRRPVDLYEKLFGTSESYTAEKLWGTAFIFKKACSAGVIGVKAMEPKGLRCYLDRNMQKMEPVNDEEKISINVYKVWILAMLNNNEMWEKTQKLAEMLCEASTDKDKAISTKRKNAVEEVLKAVNKRQFVDAATEIVPYVSSADQLKQYVKEVHCMPSDNVPYFLTLLRFQYKTVK